jgi:hypothetical protein
MHRAEDRESLRLRVVLVHDGPIREQIRRPDSVAAVLRRREVVPRAAARVRGYAARDGARDLPDGVRDRLVRALPLALVPRAPAALADHNAYGREDEEAHGGPR